MLGGRIVIGGRPKDEAEKPFWISFADLMSALMILFLVVMAIAILSITTAIREATEEERKRQDAIALVLEQLGQASQKFPGVKIDKNRFTVDLGERARFAYNDHRLSQDGEDTLRAFVPHILDIAASENGKRWIKRIVVEGFTDPDGTYLYNLDLSLKRASRVVCVLLEAPTQRARPSLNSDQKNNVQDLFLVGGFSSNATKSSKEESRRIELRLDFRALQEEWPEAKREVRRSSEFGRCAS